ncbi:unnamed protein product [Cuscuta epithymum]|uniref:Uncharacterized protein n=1 Tax=Cuscuta epithymum TaxID=186058 RepID=A0AAV0BX24_9ASTE|nr:unnamed protein product [Cuscuta epithymum]
MTGIDPKIITHKLNVNPSYKPVRQRRRRFARERNDIINQEVEALLQTGKAREVRYPDWLANVVVVKKKAAKGKKAKWRVCVDFTDLNKACPKDSFPMPHIDVLADATAGHEMLSFMDAFSGYHQIQLHCDDQEKTAFITETGTYCYIVMPFGLKNAGATFQRLVTMMFKDQIGKTMEVYIDDMIVKSRKAEDHVGNLAESFKKLTEYNLKLNPAKCAFGVSSGEFLGYIISERGIEASPEQVRAIIDIESPKSVKDVQRLTGRVAALNRFISKSSDRCRLFYDVLRKNKKFEWTDQHEQALQQLKEYMTTPPLLTKPKEGDELQLYLAVSEHAVSAVLTKEDDGMQTPVYYVSKSLNGPETRYALLEKLVLALITASVKLRPYFESHTICVRTNYPMKSIMRKPELSGRMAKWSIQLGAYDIRYEPRTALKSQTLADFVADFSPKLQTEAEKEACIITDGLPQQKWTLHTDGASNLNGAGLGVVLKSPQGDTMLQAVHCDFNATNNEAEYEALIVGLTLAKDLGIKLLQVKCDSLLIVNQANGVYAAKDPKMTSYLEVVIKLMAWFDEITLEQVPREENTQADALAAIGSCLGAEVNSNIPFIHLTSPAIDRLESVSTISSSSQDDWTQPYIAYLRHNILPLDKKEAKAFLSKVTKFLLIDDVLFKRSKAGPYQRCLAPQEAMRVLKDLHEGECGNHAAGRSLSNKALRFGYYWPTMRHDAITFTQSCQACQKHGPIRHQPSESLHPILSPWPFMKWGMDIVGKLPEAPGQKVYMLAMTDYFSKWVEAEPFRQVRDEQVISFIKRNILCRFGIPSEIVCDNGSQFISAKTRRFCERYNIRLETSTPRYPQSNGQVESSNKIIVSNLKKRLEKAQGRWADELPLILWADRTTPKNATGQTPFSLVYGCEAVIPAEIEVPSSRYGLMTEERNNVELIHDLDTIDEIREKAKIRLQSYQQMVAKSFNKNVRAKVFKKGDWVLRRAFGNEASGKFSPNWEGPYKIVDIIRQGAYRLESIDGKQVPRSWNAVHLKLFHF